MTAWHTCSDRPHDNDGEEAELEGPLEHPIKSAIRETARYIREYKPGWGRDRTFRLRDIHAAQRLRSPALPYPLGAGPESAAQCSELVVMATKAKQLANRTLELCKEFALENDVRIVDDNDRRWVRQIVSKKDGSTYHTWGWVK